MLADLLEAVRKSGLKVVAVGGWEKRTRPGSFDPRGVLVHHTGGSSDSQQYVDWMALTGRSDLPAPLCQLALGRDGTVYVCAAGRANHGGTAKATGPMPSGDANALYIGVEAMNTGSEGWTPTQYDAYVRLCAALCRHYGWPASHVRAHRETSVTGKWDPGLLDMDRFRTDIAATITEETDDMFSDEDRKTLQRVLDVVRDQRQRTIKQTTRIVTRLNKLAESTKDDATKRDLKAAVAEIQAEMDDEASSQG